MRNSKKRCLKVLQLARNIYINMAASLQSLELNLMDTAVLWGVPDYFDLLVALTSLTLSARLRVSALLMLCESVCF